MRVPVTKREAWLAGLGREGEPCTTKDPRISIAHFTADNVVASIEGRGVCAVAVVRPARDAEPTQTNSQMEDAARGASSRLLRAQAENKRLRVLRMESTSRRHELDIRVLKLQDRVKELESNKRAKTQEKDDVHSSRRNVVDFNILTGLSDEVATSLCGVKGLRGLQVSSRDSSTM